AGARAGRRDARRHPRPHPVAALAAARAGGRRPGAGPAADPLPRAVPARAPRRRPRPAGAEHVGAGEPGEPGVLRGRRGAAHVSARRSAGLLVYRLTESGDGPEVLIAHMGGPFWARKDAAAWSIPKGELDEGEEPRAA